MNGQRPSARSRLPLRDRLAGYTATVDRELERLLEAPEPVPNLHDAMCYALGLDQADAASRGKRLRPALCLAAAEALDADPARALPFACAIELLHNFALVHDDIEDGDTIRRGRPTVWQQYGLAHGVNVGDCLFSLVFSTIDRDETNPPETRLALDRLLHHTLESLFAGQALDINARQSRNFSVADYNRIVLRKTGSYLAAPVLGAAIIADAPSEVLDALRAYGDALGPLFQIKDDIIDLTTGKGRDDTGNDIREGKRSFLVAATLESCSTAEAGRLLDILDAPREETGKAHVGWAMRLFEKSGAVERAEAECTRLRAQAEAALQHVSEPLRRDLTEAAELLLNRTY